MTLKEEQHNIKNRYIKLFEDNKKQIVQKSHSILNKQRKKAIKDFALRGFPSTKNEDYKYLKVLPIFSNLYHHCFQPKPIHLDIDSVFKCNVPQLDTYSIIFVNGWLYQIDHRITNQNSKVRVESMANIPVDLLPVVEKNYAKQANSKDNFQVALNTAFAQDGTLIYFPKGQSIDKPIQIINLLMSEVPLAVNKRNLICLEEGASAKIIMCDNTFSSLPFLNNKVTEVVAKKNTHLELYNIQNQHNDSCEFSSIYFHQEENSNLTCDTFSIHGKLIRNNFYVNMAGKYCDSKVRGLYFTDKEQHIDNLSYVHHSKPNCKSDELFKGILDEDSLATFGGKILVDKGAYKTKAYQRNNNILLSESANAKSKPHLEIYNNDVECNHGATIGQLEENALFYLQTRGISKKEAQILLMYSFANEVIENISIPPLKDRINDLIKKRLYGELLVCGNCKT